MKISIVVAASENLVIGYKNALPWHISEDLKHFKQITINHSVVMGRKTFESIGKPLKERRNIVVSRDRTLKIEGAEVVNSLDEAIHQTKNENEIFIIGGEQIYKMAMPIATNLHITKVYCTVEGDAFFPTFDVSDWKILTQNDMKTNEELKFSFIHYERIV